MTGLTGTVPAHPAQYSPEIIELLRGLIEPGERIVDPFAGLGLRLGALCDELDADFSGTDIETWPGADPRVEGGDARMPLCYPAAPFTVVTSPPYTNRISTDYVNGPTETTKRAGRRAYGISLGRALSMPNLARVAKPDSDEFYAGLGAAMDQWGDRVLLNVDLPMGGRAAALLTMRGYVIEHVHRVGTRRYKVVGHGDTRAPHEIVIEAVR